jgi:retron-type reverse transcriptase
VRRAHIPKGEGRKTRPIGIPTFEDKVLQRAVTMVLEAVYEQDFRDCSYGFRPGRSAHQTLDAVWHGTMKVGGGWVLEADIQGFFEALDHRQLRSFLDERVRDGVLRRAQPSGPAQRRGANAGGAGAAEWQGHGEPAAAWDWRCSLRRCC